MNDFVPTLLGSEIAFEDEDECGYTFGMVTDETPTHVFIEHPSFGNWWQEKESFLAEIEHS